MTDDDVRNLGPLGPLAGVWVGDKGNDRAPSDDRGVELNTFRERMTFDPIGRVDNHEQTLYGLSYTTVVRRIGEDDPFHQELGYWLWDAANEQVMRCFLVPRGIALIAGGTVKADAKQFELAAEVGSETYGIVSNRFLDVEFKTVRYTLKVGFHDSHNFSYEEDSVLRIKGQSELFHHTDANTLRRVK